MGDKQNEQNNHNNSYNHHYYGPQQQQQQQQQQHCSYNCQHHHQHQHQQINGGFNHMQEHSCEICGESGLTDDNMREHTRFCHVEGSAHCPFCGLTGIIADELMLHVNQAHLDYLTPENESMSFIDDQSPSVDGDSDSISECRGLSPTITELPVVNHNKFDNNGIITTNVNLNHQQYNRNSYGNQQQEQQQQQQSPVYHQCSTSTNKNQFLTTTTTMAKQTPTIIKTIYSNNFDVSSSTSNLNNKKQKNIDKNYCDNNNSNGENKEYINGMDMISNGSQGSPLRSQLGLNLKSHVPANPATNNISPLQCPLCPYSSDKPNILEEHINRSHFDPLSPSVNNSSSSSSSINNLNNQNDTLTALACPICVRAFESASDLELHVNIEHRDILSPAKIDRNDTSSVVTTASAAGASANTVTYDTHRDLSGIKNVCPVCNISLDNMCTQEMEVHIESHFSRSPEKLTNNSGNEFTNKQAQKLREQREFEMLRAQYGMDDQGNFREQSAAAMQRAVYAGEMSVADYYERQVGLRAAESHGIDDGTSCTKSVAPRVLSLSMTSSGIIRTLVCTAVDHYASSYGDKGWGCGYRNLQMLLSSLLQNTTYNEALYSAWGKQGPSRTAMPSISRLQKMVEAAWAQGFDVQGSEQLGCKLYNTRKWIGATEVLTVLSWLRINCQLIDFHRPTAIDGKHPDLFNWVLKYFEEPKIHTPPLYLQHQGHSRTIIGVEQRASGLTLLVLDPSHGPRQVAALGSSQDSLRLIRRGPTAMRAPQYQIVAVHGLIETEEAYQASKVLRSLRIPPDC